VSSHLEALLEADLRFLCEVETSLLRHPAVRDAGSCPRCGVTAPSAAAVWRRRRVIERILVAETETFDGLRHGPVLELELPPFVICGHRSVLPLPAWETADGLVYYARHRRTWTE